MNWTELKDTIYYWDGSWRDIYISNTTKDDWEKWINFANENYKIDWFNGKVNKVEAKIDFEVIQEYWNGNFDLSSTAKVFLEKIQINAHFFDYREFENDIDPREFNSIEDHFRLTKYITDLSKILNKEVILTPENEHETVLLKAVGENIILNTKIDPSKWVVRPRN